ncbi:MAG: flippase-like domain-containing protein [Planctomycetes bacterium]|nr:flippase-like domain-containing protein [Planctomycetota bacterium]MCB9887201.1 flippase-like domain-containing protein [Planctomycetota bacterium]
MKGATGTVIKLVLVAALMFFVFRSIHFEDRLVMRDGDKVVAEQEIEIQGPWNADPITYLVGDDPQPRQIGRGAVIEGHDATIEPGFITYWHNLDPGLFALGAFCYFLTALIAGARWWWLLRCNGTDVSLLETLRFTWIGVFFNTVVPGATGGDLIKALYIMKRCPGHRVQVLVSVVVDRVLGLASLAFLGAVIVLFALDRFGEIALGIWCVIGGVGLLGLFAFSRRLRRLVRISWLLERLPQKVGHLLKLVDQAVFFYRNHGGVIVASLVAGIGNHVLSVLSVAFIGDALGVGMPWFEYFALIPVINIVSALPIGPNGWGVGEALYKLLFAKYGAAHLAATIPDPAQAAQAMGTRGVSLSVLYRLHLTFWSLLGGLFVLFEKDKVTKDDIAREVALEQREDERDDNLPSD